MQANTVLTKNQAAALLCVSIQTIDNMYKRGDLPRIQITVRRVGFLQSDIDAYLTAQRSKGGAV